MREMEGQVSLFDLGLWSGRTSPAHSAATAEETSKQSSRKSAKSQSQTAPMFLCLRKDGLNRDACTMNWGGGALHGEYTMLSFGEFPREENVSHLSQILEDSAPQRYYLSERACLGILNRAERRGKELPEILREALEKQAGIDGDNLD